MAVDPHRQSAMAHEALGRSGALAPGIGAVYPSASLFGPAYTVETAPGDNSWLHHALASAPAGAVVVCGCGGAFDFGYFGEVMAVAAKTRRLGGLLIDAKVRDTAEIELMQFPVFARGACIRGTGKGNFRFGGLGVPVAIGGLTILPGDVIIGDRDGVVIVDATRAEALPPLAAERAATEKEWLKHIRRGQLATEVLRIPVPA